MSVLLAAGAPTSTKDQIGGSTALHHAVMAGSAPCVRLLVDNKADRAATDDSGKSPMDLLSNPALAYRDKSVTRALQVLLGGLTSLA